MKIKHSKFKNTGLIYELLVRQITSDLISRKNSPAIGILRKYYSGDSVLVQEHKLYKTIVEGNKLSSVKADNLINAVLKASVGLDRKALHEEKYNLISEIKQHYNINGFFSTTVKGYRQLAALYCLIEANSSKEFVDPQSVVNNRMTLLEHMTCREQSKEVVVESLIEEYSKYDKDLRLLTFKVLLEKYNRKYSGLLDEQKTVLRKAISLGLSKELRDYVNEEYLKIRTKLQEVQSRMPRGIEKIKLLEAAKLLQPVPATVKISDGHVVKLLQFYDLIQEIKALNL